MLACLVGCPDGRTSVTPDVACGLAERVFAEMPALLGLPVGRESQTKASADMMLGRQPDANECRPKRTATPDIVLIMLCPNLFMMYFPLS
jgi:hypothetical protein